MTGADLDHGLIDELRNSLIREELADGINLLARAQDDVVQLHIMAIDLGRLGMLLATLSRPGELADPASLSSRLAPGDNDGADGRWRYELVAGRYPHNGEMVFSALVSLPVGDLPEVLFRLT